MVGRGFSSGVCMSSAKQETRSPALEQMRMVVLNSKERENEWTEEMSNACQCCDCKLRTTVQA